MPNGQPTLPLKRVTAEAKFKLPAEAESFRAVPRIPGWPPLYIKTTPTADDSPKEGKIAIVRIDVPGPVQFLHEDTAVILV